MFESQKNRMFEFAVQIQPSVKEEGKQQVLNDLQNCHDE